MSHLQTLNWSHHRLSYVRLEWVSFLNKKGLFALECHHVTYTNQKQFKNSINVLWWMFFGLQRIIHSVKCVYHHNKDPKLSKISPGFEPATSSWWFFFQNTRWTQSRLGSLRPGASCSATEIQDPDRNRTRRRKPDQVSSRDQVSGTKVTSLLNT